ncbi:MAG: hypothetical protein QGH47_06595 [Candidatus Woesearchaeota archaeon]|jgi:16S rRNA U1498 N3-methylase RsmE|nr:hypothetical protein [Candidatus Woesearchaeota archaeon]
MIAYLIERAPRFRDKNRTVRTVLYAKLKSGGLDDFKVHEIKPRSLIVFGPEEGIEAEELEAKIRSAMDGIHWANKHYRLSSTNYEDYQRSREEESS